MAKKKIPDRLQEMIDEGVIDDVRAKLLSGKEASVYVVERDDDLFAAKVYKEREGRSFKNVASYVDGRNQTRNSRDKRAMNRKTRYGKELAEGNWRETEHNALQRAFDAGVRVPEPYLLYEEVLLMELVCDEHGAPAPRLADFELTREVAALLHLEAFLQVRRLLAAGLIHGDLSAFNILVAEEGLTLIDMPQIIEASVNSEAKELLHRDLKNLTEHLAKFDPGLLKFTDCGEPMWRHYELGTLDSVREPQAGGSNRRGRRLRQGQGDGRGEKPAPRGTGNSAGSGAGGGRKRSPRRGAKRRADGGEAPQQRGGGAERAGAGAEAGKGSGDAQRGGRGNAQGDAQRGGRGNAQGEQRPSRGRRGARAKGPEIERVQPAQRSAQRPTENKPGGPANSPPAEGSSREKPSGESGDAPKPRRRRRRRKKPEQPA